MVNTTTQLQAAIRRSALFLELAEALVIEAAALRADPTAVPAEAADTAPGLAVQAMPVGTARWKATTAAMPVATRTAAVVVVQQRQAKQASAAQTLAQAALDANGLQGAAHITAAAGVVEVVTLEAQAELVAAVMAEQTRASQELLERPTQAAVVVDKETPE